MGNYEQLKQSVSDVIKTNGNQEITGSILQNVLLTIISTVGANATFAGVATPATNPGTPDGSVFYLASESGTYTNFNAIELQDGLSVLLWNGSWSSQQILNIDDEPTAGSDNLVKSGGVSKVEQNAITGGTSLHYVYNGNHELGEEFEPLQLQSSGLWNYYEMDCQEGDVIYAKAYSNYLLITDSNNIILKSIASPYEGNAPKWFIAPSGSTKVHLCGLASQESFLYVFNKKNILQRTFLKRMFLEQDFIGTYWNAAAFITPSVPFNFYESLGNQSSYASDDTWRTMIINVENCPKVCITAYGNNAFSLQATTIVPAYVFFDKDMMAIAGASKGLTPYVNELIDVPSNAVYCLAQSRKNVNDVMLYAITDKEYEILDNVVQTREQTLSDEKKKQAIKNLGITINTDGVFDIENKGYYCNAVTSNIGDVVTPILVANNDWCSNILDVKEGDEVYFFGYQTRYIVLDSENTVISKGFYGNVQNGRIVIPEGGVKFVYATFSSQVKFVILVTYLSIIATNSLINNTVSREPINIVSVKKDGTGDYTSIQAAIDAVKSNASINNQYQIRIYDDWEFEAQDLHYLNSGDCAVETANYVHLYGMNGIRTLKVVAQDVTYQVLWWIGNSNLENLHFKITGSRYAVHQSGYYSGRNPEYITRKAVNCIFEHIGNIAVGTDIQNGEDTTFNGCTFIGRATGWYGHSTLVSYDALIKFNNCTFKVPFGTAAGIQSLDSICQTTLTMNNCKLDPTSCIENMGCGSYSNGNGLPVGAVAPKINVYGCGNYLFKTKQLSYLRLVASANVSITSITGTALQNVFGGVQYEQSGENGLAGVKVGDNNILYQASLTSHHPYLYSLGCRLGDCSAINKTLIVTLSDGQTATITFDKAYTSDETGVAAPIYTNEQIIAEMNTALNVIGVTVSEGFGSEYDFYPNTDIKEYVAAETNVIPQKKFVHIKENGLAEIANGNNVDGFALADIPIMPSSNKISKSAICTSKQILLGQVYSPTCPNTTDGTKFTITNGELVEVSSESTDYVAIVYNNILKLK